MFVWFNAIWNLMWSVFKACQTFFPDLSMSAQRIHWWFQVVSWVMSTPILSLFQHHWQTSLSKGPKFMTSSNLSVLAFSLWILTPPLIAWCLIKLLVWKKTRAKVNNNSVTYFDVLNSVIVLNHQMFVTLHWFHSFHREL